MDRYSHDGKNKYSHNMNLYQLTLRHGSGGNTMKQQDHEMSELGKIVGNECLDCPFNMSFKTEIVDYCLNECYGGRRDMVDDNAR